MVHSCQHERFLDHPIRAFTAEVPLYRRLVEQCVLVNKPEMADVLVASVWMGTLIAMGWAKPRVDGWMSESIMC